MIPGRLCFNFFAFVPISELVPVQWDVEGRPEDTPFIVVVYIDLLRGQLVLGVTSAAECKLEGFEGTVLRVANYLGAVRRVLFDLNEMLGTRLIKALNLAS